jgi:ApaG protein
MVNALNFKDVMSLRGSYSHVEHDIRVTVVPTFQLENSSPDTTEYIWTYILYIQNESGEDIQLHSRYWTVVDSQGKEDLIMGPDAIGEGAYGACPVISSGKIYEYQNIAYLRSPGGFMRGVLQFMKMRSRILLDVAVPTFSLDSPYQYSRVN